MTDDEQQESDEDSGFISPTRIASIAARAKLMGKQAAVPLIQRVLREQLVLLLRQHDPDELRQFIDVQYPLVDEEMPDGYKTALGKVGPEYEDQIKAMVHPDQIKAWFNSPEQWMDPEEKEDVYYEVLEVGEILDNHPGADEWLSRQVLDVYQMCGIEMR